MKFNWMEFCNYLCICYVGYILFAKLILMLCIDEMMIKFSSDRY